MAKSILVADESRTIREVVELTFNDSACHVESVGRGAFAVRCRVLPRRDPAPADRGSAGTAGRRDRSPRRGFGTGRAATAGALRREKVAA